MNTFNYKFFAWFLVLYPLSVLLLAHGQRFQHNRATPLEHKIYERLQQAEKMRQKADAAKDTRKAARALLIQATAMAEVEEPENALNLALRARQLAGNKPTDTLAADATETLGLMQLAVADTSAAMISLKYASMYQNRLGQFARAKRNDIRLALLKASFLHDRTAADSMLKGVSHWAESNTNTSTLAWVALARGQLATQAGRSAEAVSLFRHVFAMAQNLGQEEKALCLAELGKVALQEKQGALAAEATLQAYKLAKQLHHFYLQKNLLYKLAECDFALQDPARAYTNLRAGHLLDKQLSQEKTKMLGTLTGLLVNNAAFMRENELLRQEKELQTQTADFNNVILILGLMLGLVLAGMLANTWQANKRKRKLLMLLQTQNDENLVQKEKIQDLNLHLEQQVVERTRTLQERTVQLLEYANYNSHMVRGPLARILGLTYLLQHTEDKKEAGLFIQKISQSAQEMDQALKVVNRKLDVKSSEYVKSLTEKAPR